MQYLPWLVPVAVAHLTMLRERVLFGPQLYCNITTNFTGGMNGTYRFSCNSPAPAAPIWLKSLVDQYSYYASLFNVLVPQWRSWRATLIRNASSSASWSASDALSGISVSDVPLNSTAGGECMECFARGTAVAMLNEATALLLDQLSPVQLLAQLVPGFAAPDNAPVIATYAELAELGPYAPSSSAAALAGYWNSSDSDDDGGLLWDGPGIIDAVSGHAGELINQLTVRYSAPPHVGGGLNSSGANPFSFAVAANVGITAFNGYFAKQGQFAGIFPVLSGLQLQSSNGTLSALVGTTAAAQPIARFNSTAGAAYALVETAQARVPLPQLQLGNPNLIGVMGLRFAPLALAGVGAAARVVSLVARPVARECQPAYAGVCSDAVPCCDPVLECLRHTHSCNATAGQLATTTTYLCVDARAIGRTAARAAPATVSVAFFPAQPPACATALTLNVTNLLATLIGSASLSVSVTGSSFASVPRGCLQLVGGTSVQQTMECVVDALPARHGASLALQLANIVTRQAVVSAQYAYFTPQNVLSTVPVSSTVLVSC